MNTRLTISILIDGTVTKESARVILQNIVAGTPSAFGGMIQELKHVEEDNDDDTNRDEYERLTGRCYDCGKEIKQGCTCLT